MSPYHDILVVNDRMLDAQETVALEQVAPRAKVLHLDNGREAVEYLFSVGDFAGRAPVMPQMILLSAEMRDISSLCLLDLIRAHPLTRAIPTILLSLERDIRKFRRHAEFDADAYVLKPLDFPRFCTLLHGCIDAVYHQPFGRAPDVTRPKRPRSSGLLYDSLNSTIELIAGLRNSETETLGVSRMRPICLTPETRDDRHDRTTGAFYE